MKNRWRHDTCIRFGMHQSEGNFQADLAATQNIKLSEKMYNNKCVQPRVSIVLQTSSQSLWFFFEWIWVNCDNNNLKIASVLTYKDSRVSVPSAGGTTCVVTWVCHLIYHITITPLSRGLLQFVCHYFWHHPHSFSYFCSNLFILMLVKGFSCILIPFQIHFALRL